MSKNLLNTDGSVTNYWWDCPSCGETKISSVLHDDEGNIKGATMCCPECCYVLKGEENTYVDETVYEIPPEWVALLEQPRWKCQQCGALNEKPSEEELKDLTIDDLYCQSCETWQCDIPGTPNYNPNAALERYKKVEKKSRWENPIAPVELQEDKENLYGKNESNENNNVNEVKANKKSPHLKTKVGICAGIFSTFLFAHDGVRVREVNGEITNANATVSVNISKYEIVKKEGWNPNTSASDYKLISKFQKQDGTREVPDGVETYFETEKYIARYEKETYTETVSEKVQDGTKTVKGKCKTVTSGAVAKTQCEPDKKVPVYKTKTKQVTKTREVPVYETKQVEKTRQKYRSEPVYKTWYVWEQGEWLNAQTLTEQSNTFEIKYPDTSKFQNQPKFRVGEAQKKCNVTLKAQQKNLPSQNLEINCSLYEKLSQGDSGTVLYSKWNGIKDIKLEEN